MKKIVFAAAVAVAVLLTGCKQVTSNIETIKANALEITAKALPGFNYVTWSMPVDGAQVTVMRDDGTVLSPEDRGVQYALDANVQDGVEYTYTVYTGTPSNVTWQFSGTGVNNISDVDTLEGVRYEGNSASASCTAINPGYIKDGKLMSAIELCDYEEGGNADFVVKPENIVVEVEKIDGSDYVVVAYPTKNYLSYTTKLYRGNGLEMFGRDLVSAESMTSAETDDTAVYNSFYSNDGTYRANIPVTNAGEYSVEVVVAAKAPKNDKTAKKYSTSYVKAEKKVTFETLDASTATGDPVAGYIDAGKTVRVVWTPAKKADTTKWAADSYKVFVKDAKGVYTEIAPAKTAKLDEEGEEVKDEDGNVVMETKLAIAAGAQKGEDVYYIDYAIPNNKVGYSFYVVLSDNGKYESLEKSYTVNAYAELDKLTVEAANKTIKAGNTLLATYKISNEDLDKATGDDVIKNDVVLTFSDVNKDLVIKSVKYKTVAMNDNNRTYTTDNADLILDPEFSDAATNPAEYGKQSFVVKNVAIDSKVVFLVTVNAKVNGKEAYKDTMFTVVSDAVNSATPAINPGEFSVSAPTGAANEAKKVKVTVTPGTYEKNAQYTYTVFYAKVVDNTSVAGITAWTQVAVTPVYDDATDTWTGTSAGVTLDPTTIDGVDIKDGSPNSWKDSYVFKYVKTNKADVNKFAVGYSSVMEVTKNK